MTVPLGLSQHVSGLGITLLATSLASYAYRVSFPKVDSPPTIQPFADMSGWLPLPVLNQQTPLTLLALLLVPALAWLLYRTPLGLALRMVGENPEAVEGQGLSVARLRTGAVVAGSALMGVAGAFLTLAAFNAFYFNMVNGRGWVCVALVVFASWRPGRALRRRVVVRLLRRAAVAAAAGRLGAARAAAALPVLPDAALRDGDRRAAGGGAARQLPAGADEAVAPRPALRPAHRDGQLAADEERLSLRDRQRYAAPFRGSTRRMASEPRHIRLTSHPGQQGPGGAPAIHWGAADALERGPIVGTTGNRSQRNVIGTHSGSYGVYRALAVAAGNLTARPPRRPDQHRAHRSHRALRAVGRRQEDRVDRPVGRVGAAAFADYIEQGYDIRPTIAVTKAHIHLPEIKQAIAFQRLAIDGTVLLEDASATVTKIAIEPVWWLPGVAERFKVGEAELRRALFEETGGMYPELVTRSDLEVFLPPIGGQTLYVFGDVRDLSDPAITLTARVHDECNGSDVFGSDICTCRPYLTHAIEECIQGAQHGGVGLIAYSRKEGRALGEVTKFLVYNARKRQEGGDRADKYFLRTECVAGVQDMRFQELMPDVLHWLGIRKIHRLVSMSNDKYDAITGSGIEVGERVKIPDALIPADAKVEIEAKIAAGYFTDGAVPDEAQLAAVKGRGLE